MSARNNQINVAYSLIDRMAGAIDTDRKNRLAYYKTMYKFYQTARDEEGRKLFILTKDERDWTEAQIGLLKSDMDTAKKTIDYLKSLMIDPRSADLMEKAGIKLTDSIDEINVKLADATYQEDIIGTIDKMALKGYKYLPSESQWSIKPKEELIRVYDSRGKQMVFWSAELAKKKETAKGLFIDSATGKSYDFGTVAGLKQFKADYPEYTYEDINAYMDANLKLDTKTREGLLKAAGYAPAAEMERKWDDERIKDIIKRYLKPGNIAIKEMIKSGFQRNKDFTEADKARALELTDQMIPDEMDEWLKRVREQPDKYYVKEDAVWEKVAWWRDKKVYSFPK